MFAVPSPKIATATRPVLRARAAIAAPQAIGRPAPTIAAVGNSPTLGSTRCIEPPKPPAQPMVRPQISPITPAGVTPSASAWPCPPVGAGHDVIRVNQARDADGNRFLAVRERR